jgi:hypothetical protein
MVKVTTDKYKRHAVTSNKKRAIMTAPRMTPSGTMDVTSHATMDGKIRVLGYGEDDRAINPGDLLLIGSNWMRENGRLIETEFVLKLRGKDIDYFVQAAVNARLLYDDNKHWLQASMSQPGVDTRSMSGIRAADQSETLHRFLAN